MSGKEAIIFIVDANHSMNAPYPGNKHDDSSLNPDNDPPPSRLSAVKDAILHKITTMAWQSSHEFGIVVLKTLHTHHHLYSTNCSNISKLLASDETIKTEGDDDIPFPNQIEVELTRPSHHMLKTIQFVQTLPSGTQTPEADFCQSLILAADTLYRRTAGKKYKRSIVLFTDAEHEVEVDGERLECVLTGLRKMDVSLEVVGLGFCEEGVFVKQEEKEDEDDVDGCLGECEDNAIDLCESDEEMTHDEAMQDHSQDIQTLIKRENEKLLVSLTQQTGGCVLAANGQDIYSLLESYYANNTSYNSTTDGRAVRSKCLFRITPNLTIEARYSKIIGQKSLPSLKTDAFLLDETTGQPLKDGLGEYMTTPIDSITYHTLELDPPGSGTIEVPLESRTDAYRFGSDLIPIGKMDMAGINAAFKSPKIVEMIGYIPSKMVTSSGLTMGPAYALFGGRESKRSMAAVAALAEAMEKNDLWGHCRFVKSQNGDPRLAVLVPQKVEYKTQTSLKSDGSCGWHFALLQLPFADDVNPLKPPEVPLEHWGDNNETSVCDDLIDSLMIDDDELDSTSIPFPALKSYQRMIARFAMNPIVKEEERTNGLSEERILEACGATPLGELEVVKMLADRGSRQIDSFLETFPLTKVTSDGKKPERKYWGDD